MTHCYGSTLLDQHFTNAEDTGRSLALKENYTYLLCLLCVYWITKLQQSLKLVILCECDYLQYSTKFREYLPKTVQFYTCVSPNTVQAKVKYDLPDEEHPGLLDSTCCQ